MSNAAYSQPKLQEGELKRDFFPNEARLRSLTYLSLLKIFTTVLFLRYATRLFVDVKKETKSEINPALPASEVVDEDDAEQTPDEVKKILLADVPVMVRSVLCRLNSLSTRDSMKMGECPVDQVKLL